MKEGDIVTDFLQVADDMGRNQHRMAFLPGKFSEQLHHLVAHHRVQSIGGLIQKQQLRMMGQRHGDSQLHFHSSGKFFEFPVRGNGEAAQIFFIFYIVPALENPLHHFPDLPCLQAFRKAHIIQHNADLFLEKGQIALVITSQNGDGSAVSVDHVQKQFDGGALSRAVLSHQSHDAAARQRQAQPVQSEMGIFLRQVFDFQCIHLQSSMMQSSMSIRSCLLKLQVAASCVIFSRYSSIFLRFSSLRSSTFLGATKQPLAAMV